MRAEVAEGLSGDPKTLPPKYFYDARGSRLFDEITRLPEYYLTRTEGRLLEEWIPRWTTRWHPRAFVELGAGSSEKSRIVLEAMLAAGGSAVYVPVDVSGDALETAAERLRADYDRLAVRPVVADVTVGLSLPSDIPRPAWFAFLGSTIGNFEREAAIGLLGRVRAAMEACDRFLLGVDLKKDPDRLNAAYNDSRGVTEEFNRNMLRVLNHELGADFDVDAFEHRAAYVPERGRVEIHLVSRRDQTVSIPEVGSFEFPAGEAIRTEISTKYDRDSVADLCGVAGLRIEAWVTDPEDLFALALAARAAKSCASNRSKNGEDS